MTHKNYSHLKTIAEMIGEDEEETEQFRALYAEAKSFFESFIWAGQIRTVYFGAGVADLVGVFLFEHTPASVDVDSCLWVIVGDIPPAYLVVDCATTAAGALTTYISEMQEWISAVNSGTTIENCIPVNVPATKENAAALIKRLNFLEKEILPAWRCDTA